MMRTNELLRRAADGLGDSLKPETRRRLVRQGLAAISEPAPQRAGWLSLSLTAGSAVAMVVFALLLPSVMTAPTGTASGLEQAALTPVRDFSVVAEGEKVVLNWSDGGAPRKVFRATSHHELSNIRALPAKVVAGETWVDEEPATAPIVYYVIE